jgi:hypothetical protein
VGTQKGRRNIFFLRSDASKTLEHILAEVSMAIGFDMIDNPLVNWERWSNSSIPERVQTFLTWLGNTCNKDSLLAIDDIETFGQSNVQTILKYPAWHIVVSTRHSDLTSKDREFREIRLQTLGNDDTVSILSSAMNLLAPGELGPFSEAGLESIARTVHGHPLAACIAIPFIVDRLATYEDPIEAFLGVLKSRDPEELRTFLDFKLDGLSLRGAFETSMERLQFQEKSSEAMELFRLLLYLRSDHDCIDDFLKIQKQWLKDCAEELPDVSVLAGGFPVISELLSKLRSVSLYLRTNPSNQAKSLNIHPLVVQYALLRVGEQDRLSTAKQIFQLLYEMEARGAKRDSQIRPHVLHCIEICQRLGVTLDNLGLPGVILHWVIKFLFSSREIQADGLQEVGGDPFFDPADSVASAGQEFMIHVEITKRLLKGHVDPSSHDSVANMIMQCVIRYKKLKIAFEQSGELTELVSQKLEESVGELSGIVKLTSVYPDLAAELESFGKKLGKSIRR